MRTTIHNHLRGQNGCLGFYYGLASLLSAYPEGGLPGEFFINGETQSIWIWILPVVRGTIRIMRLLLRSWVLSPNRDFQPGSRKRCTGLFHLCGRR